VLLAAGAAVGGATARAGVEIAASGGLRLGGEVASVRVETNPVEASAAFGLTLDVPLAPDKFIAVTWSRQSTDAELRTLFAEPTTFDLNIDYLHAGGVYRPRREGRSEPFVMLTLGLTRVDPTRPGFDEGWGISGAVGGGARFPLSERWGLRVEGRGWFTFSEASLSGVCGGIGCSVSFGGSGGAQFEGLVGASVVLGSP
jgi:hypothetical protein